MQVWHSSSFSYLSYLWRCTEVQYIQLPSLFFCSAIPIRLKGKISCCFSSPSQHSITQLLKVPPVWFKPMTEQPSLITSIPHYYSIFLQLYSLSQVLLFSSKRQYLAFNCYLLQWKQTLLIKKKKKSTTWRPYGCWKEMKGLSLKQ